MHKTGDDLAGMMILIVDDNIHNLQVLLETLQEEKFDVSVAQDGEKALQVAKRLNPDLILLDIMMPGMDGLETCRRLKADPSTADIPVIFLSAKADANDVVDGFEAGGSDYLTKPFHREETLARVHTQLNLKRTTRRLKDTIDSLYSAQRESLAKSHFLSQMSHEFRTPLNGIKGFAQLLNYSAHLDEEDRQSTQEILKATDHLLHMIENILDLSDRDAGRNFFVRAEFDLNEVVNEVVREHGKQAEESGVTLTCNPNDTPVRIRGDRKWAQHILDSLLRNAIQYNVESGKIQVDLTVSDAMATVAVQSTGEKIPDDLLEKIFEPFFRIDGQESGVDGLGLGLTLSKKYAESMEGSIRAENTPDGSCFYWEIPVHS